MAEGKRLRDILAEPFGTIRRHWDDGDFDDVKVVEMGQMVADRLSRAYTGTRDAVSRIRNDYDGLDVWNLGDSLLVRMADLADEMAETGEYRLLSSELTGEDLLGMAEAFRAYEASASVRQSTIHVESLRTPEGKATLDAICDGIAARFIVAWDEFGEKAFACPVGHDGRTKTPLSVMVANRLRHRPRIRSMEQARIDELRRIVAMLRAYCEGNYGVPFEYAKKHGRYEHLTEYGKGWKKEPLPLEVRFWGNSDITNGAETVKDVGADYALYIADIVKATEGIEAWCEWLDGAAHGFSAEDSIYPALATLGTTDLAPSVAHVEDAIRGDFLRSWHWIGSTIFDLWM